MKSKQTIAYFLSAVMASTTYSIPAYAATEQWNNEFCKHHDQHNEKCGYVEAVPSVACHHEHTDDCYTIIKNCVQEQMIQDNPMLQNAKIRHECTEESGCIVKELNCNHEHDADCMYQEGVLGSPCTFVCDICEEEQNGIEQDEHIIENNQSEEADILTPEFSRMLRSNDTISVSTPTQFEAALQNNNIKTIYVTQRITLGDKADPAHNKRMYPIEIPENKRIIGSGSDAILTFRSPMQLTGDNVTFENIKMEFSSADTLGSVVHREIFLAGHSLTFKNVDTYLAGSGGALGPMGSSEAELLPTVYAGGYPGAKLGNHASLTVEGTDTQFKGIYMGAKKASEYQGDYAPYTGQAELVLDAKTVVKDGIFVAGNPTSITLQNAKFAKSYDIEGDADTTLIVGQNVSYAGGVVKYVGTITLEENSDFKPAQGTTLKNVDVTATGAKLDLSDMGNATIEGNFTGGANVVLDKNGSLTILGTINNQTTLDVGIGQVFVDGKTYVTTGGMTPNVDAFQVSVDKQNDYTLDWNAEKNGWVIHYTEYNQNVENPIITKVEVSPDTTQIININDIHYDEFSDVSVPTAAPFEIKWYEQKDGIEQLIAGSVARNDVNIFYDNIEVVKTEYLEGSSFDSKTDWFNPIQMKPSETNDNIYYLFGDKNNTQEGEYTIFFVTNNSDEFDDSIPPVDENNVTIAELKRKLKFDEWKAGNTDKTPIKAQAKVKLYKPAENPDTPQTDITDKITLDTVASPQKYTGSPIQPKVTNVQYDGQPLTENQDYIVKYENNIEVGQGKAKVVIVGIGKYTGQKEILFDIVKGDADATFTTEQQSYTYGDDIVFTFQATPRKTNAVQSRRSKRASANTVEFYYKDTLLATVPVDHKNQAVFTYQTTSKKIPVGQDLEIRAEFGGSSTLEPATATKTVTINKKQMDIASVRLDNITYDGTTNTLPITYATLKGNAGDTVRVSGTAQVNSVNAGSYTQATITKCELLGDDKNWYTLTMPSAPVTVAPSARILKANGPAPREEMILLSNTTTTEQTKDIQQMIALSAPYKVTGYQLGTCDLGSGVLSQQPTLDAATGVLKFTPTGTQGTAKIPVMVALENHTDMQVTIGVTVSAKPTAKLNLVADNATYSKTPYRDWHVDSSINQNQIETSYYDVAEGTTSTTPPTNAGKYMVTVKFKDSSDKVGQETAFFAITPKEVVIKAKDREVNKNEKLPDLKNPAVDKDYAYEAGKAPIGNDDIGTLIFGYKTVTNTDTAGVYENEINGILQGTANPNYHVTITPGKLTIKDSTTPSEPVKSISIAETLQLKKGDTHTFNVTVDPQGANPDLEWTSDAQAVAMVDQTGKVTAVGKGEATITVKVKDTSIQDTCKVTVSEDGSVTPSVNSISIAEKLELKKGDTHTLSVTVDPQEANPDLEWTSDAQAVATVDQTGKVTAVGKGEATITVKVKGTSIQDTCKVTVSEDGSVAPSVNSISITEKLELKKGDTHTFNVTVDPQEANPDLEWTSDAQAVATVDQTGKVTAVGKGEATITVKVKGTTIQDTCTITVTEYSGGGGGGNKHHHSKPNTQQKPDGSKIETVKKPDGTIITTTTRPNGDKTVVETKKDGSSITETKKADGTTAITKTNAQGQTNAEVKVSEKAVQEAAKADQPVVLPVPPVTPNKNHQTAPVVTVDTGSQESVNIIIPVVQPTAGTVVVMVNADGTEEVIRKTVTSMSGVTISVEDGATVKIVDNAKSFTDTQKHWAKDAIDFVTSRELYYGTSQTTFTPNGGMTRGMLAQVLYNLENNPEVAAKNAFYDVNNGLWCSDAISWAAQNGIVSGYKNGKFGVNDNITREQLVVMLYRYAGTPAHSRTALTFTDTAQVSGFAQDAMQWAVENGIISGNKNHTLNPKGTATRAQVASMLMRFVAKIQQ